MIYRFARRGVDFHLQARFEFQNNTGAVKGSRTVMLCLFEPALASSLLWCETLSGAPAAHEADDAEEASAEQGKRGRFRSWCSE